MQQVGPVFANSTVKIEAQAQKWIGGDAPGSDPGRDELARFLRRHVRHEFAVLILSCKRIQQTANVNLIAGKVAADGMSINGNAH
jgi:hypothetical protein